MKAGAGDLAANHGKDPTQADIESDETAAARQAVVEGQAMVVLIDYMLEPTGQSLKDSPQIVEALKQGMLVGTADSIQFHNAPLYLKEALTFPYRFGIDFVADVLAKNGKEKAFAGVFANPPRTTREIMEPKTYLSGEHLQPMRMRCLDRRAVHRRGELGEPAQVVVDPHLHDVNLLAREIVHLPASLGFRHQLNRRVLESRDDGRPAAGHRDAASRGEEARAAGRAGALISANAKGRVAGIRAEREDVADAVVLVDGEMPQQRFAAVVGGRQVCAFEKSWMTVEIGQQRHDGGEAEVVASAQSLRTISPSRCNSCARRTASATGVNSDKYSRRASHSFRAS